MKTIIIISGHGKYATGFRSTIELLAGSNPDIHYLDLLITDTDVTLLEKIRDVIMANEQANILFICDILGGTPFKVAAQVAIDCERAEVIAGCNIGAILEGIFQKDTLSLIELADSIVESSKRTTIRLKKYRENELNRTIETKTGI